MKRSKLSLSLDPFSLFSCFRGENRPLFLDSSLENALGKYSFILFDPFDVIEISQEKGAFETIEKALSPFHVTNTTPYPFIGGAVGYLGYELYQEVEKIDSKKKSSFPLALFGLYDFVIVYDHTAKSYELLSLEIAKPIKAREAMIREKLSSPLFCPNTTASSLTPLITKKQYLKQIHMIKEYIEKGDVYQINFTQMFRAKSDKSPLCLYRDLRTLNPAPFSCYMECGGFQILSSSPERFIKKNGTRITTRPMKGTIEKGKTSKESKINREKLQNSLKEKAELLMIVDLERNDMSKLCKPFSVKTTLPFEIEEYTTLFQQVTDVEGELRENISLAQILKAFFSGRVYHRYTQKTCP